MNLAHVITAHDGGGTALVDGDRSVDFAELHRLVARLRIQLAERGIGPGDVVALACGNEVHFATASLAALGLGAIVMPLNPSSTEPEFISKVETGDARIVLVGEFGRRQLELADKLGVEMVELDDLEKAATDLDPADAPPIVERDPGDAAFHMATSGVSGTPKIAVLSHGNLDWVQDALSQTSEPLTSDDVMLGVLPFVHIFGLNVVLFASLRAGACVVLQRRFDADESLELVQRHGVTLLTGAPPMWYRWADADVPDDALSTVRWAASGAAALPLGTFEKVKARFGLEISQGYGLTETSPVVTTGRGAPIRPSSVGKILDGVTVALVDATGQPVDVGDEGEIVIKSPGVFQGYYGDQVATDSVLTDDGWLWTGDVGIFDDDGYLYLVDRIKDVVIVSGFNVYPAEVENVLMKHPKVNGAIVTGQEHVETGEMVVAHVTGDATEEELVEFVEHHLSRYKRPGRYHFLDELPIAATGKAIRRALR